MKRLHVHVSVENLAESVRFYSSLFANEPTVQKEDYAKWMLEDPRMNFAISQRGDSPGLNHLGIQVESGHELNHMQSRLEALQPGVEKEEGVACCYARSDKYWVTDPQGIAWETFHSLDTIPVFGREGKADSKAAATCIPLANPEQKVDAPCCVPATVVSPAAAKCC